MSWDRCLQHQLGSKTPPAPPAFRSQSRCVFTELMKCFTQDFVIRQQLLLTRKSNVAACRLHSEKTRNTNRFRVRPRCNHSHLPSATNLMSQATPPKRLQLRWVAFRNPVRVQIATQSSRYAPKPPKIIKKLMKTPEIHRKPNEILSNP